jgi:hypothetical protein
MATETIYLRVDPALDKDLRRFAARKELTLSALLVGILGDWVEKEKAKR